MNQKSKSFPNISITKPHVIAYYHNPDDSINYRMFKNESDFDTHIRSLKPRRHYFIDSRLGMNKK